MAFHGYSAGEVCEDCIRQFFTECAECGELFETDSMTDTSDGLVCEECLSENYASCYHCGEFHNVNDMTYIEWLGEYVCESCFDDRYIYCHDCGQIESRDNAYYVDNYSDYICESCYDNNYVTCYNCGEIIPIDEAHEDDYGDFYCESCYYDMEENMESDEIMSYHGNRGVWQSYKTDRDVANTNLIGDIELMGAEIEVEHKNNSATNESQAVEILRENLNCYLERDGSLNYGGFEIVTQPQTFNYFMDNYEKYKNAFGKIVELGYVSHNSSHCGLHFHFTAPKEHRDDIVCRLWLIIEHFKTQFEEISRRKGSFSYCHFLSENNPKMAFSSMYKMKAIDKDGSRYLVINNQNSKTIEIRLFKGTLNVDTFYANLELTHNLFTLAYDLNTKIEDITWAKLTKGKYISKYCKENNIHCRRKFKDQTEKYMSLENRIDKVAKSMYNDFYRLVVRANKEYAMKNKVNFKMEEDYITSFRRNNSNLYNLFAKLYDLGEKIKRKQYNWYFMDSLNDFKNYAKELNITINTEKADRFENLYKKLRA